MSAGDRRPMKAVPGLRPGDIPPPPARPRAVPSIESSPTPAQKVDDASKRPGTPKRGSGTTKQRSRTAVPSAAQAAITLSIPAQLRDAVRDRARQERTSQPDIVMDAVSTTHDDLTDLLAEHRLATASSRTHDDGLFQRSTRERSSNNDPLTTLSLRLSSHNVEVLDSLTAQLQADSRSQLCVVALRAYLEAPNRAE